MNVNIQNKKLLYSIGHCDKYLNSDLHVHVFLPFLFFWEKSRLLIIFIVNERRTSYGYKTRVTIEKKLQRNFTV